MGRGFSSWMNLDYRSPPVHYQQGDFLIIVDLLMWRAGAVETLIRKMYFLNFQVY